MRRRYVIALIKHETNTFSPIATPITAFGHGNGPAFGDAARLRFAGTNTPMGAYLDIADARRRRNRHAGGRRGMAVEQGLARDVRATGAAAGGRRARRLRCGLARPARRDGDRGLRRRRRRNRQAPARHRAATADRGDARLPHQSVGGPGRQRHGHHRLQDLPARRHVRRRQARRRHPGAHARRRDRAGDGVGLAAAARVDHASRARGRPFRRHRALRARNGERAARCWPRRSSRRSRTPTHPTPAYRRSSSAMRNAAARRPRRKFAIACWRSPRERRAEYAFVAPAAGGVGRPREALGADGDQWPRVAHRSLRQLRVGRRAGRDDGRRRDPAPGTRRRRDRADPRCRRAWRR